MKKAISAVDDGMGMRKASKTYGIPYITFREWCYGQRTFRKRGCNGVLAPGEEQLLVEWLIKMNEVGHGLSPTTLKMKVNEITKFSWTPFKNGIPGRGWMQWFKQRHPELS